MATEAQSLTALEVERFWSRVEKDLERGVKHGERHKRAD